MIYVEAIANALDAKATEITISIDYKDRKFNKFKIVDNGVGFSDERYKRFANLMDVEDSSHKGQGRLVYLHYFKNVVFHSIYNENGVYKRKKFEFNFDFDEKKFEVEDCNAKHTGTEICFVDFSMDRIRTKNTLSANTIKDTILSEFLPSFQKMKEKKNSIKIEINTNIDGEIKNSNISIDDIPNFNCIKIDTQELKNISSKLYSQIEEQLFREPLTLYYYINMEKNENKSIITSFAIDNRAIKVPIIDESNHINGIEAIFFISSRNFDGLVDPTRKELTISQNDLKEIKKVFKQKIEEILEREVPIFKTNKEKEEKFFIDSYPHLVDYIPKSEIGFSSRQEILYSARDKFFDDQREILEKTHLTDEDYKKALDISSRNLAEYIIFRQKQIEKLKTIERKDLESVIHDLISPKKDVEHKDNINIFRNNAWILDDRFMSFYYSFSDTTLNRISEIEIFGKKSSSNERPDFLLLFSTPVENNSNISEKEIDIVIFEFKRLNVDKHEKLKAASELTTYAHEIKNILSSEIKVGRIWLYALVDIDDEFKEKLGIEDFKSRFSPQGEIWYKYYEKLSLEVSFLDFNALIYDASMRNETFIKILKDSFTIN